MLRIRYDAETAARHRSRQGFFMRFGDYGDSNYWRAALVEALFDGQHDVARTLFDQLVRAPRHGARRQVR